MRNLWLELPVDTENLAEDISELSDIEVLEFVLLLNAHMTSTSFTLELIDKLQEALDAEENS